MISRALLARRWLLLAPLAVLIASCGQSGRVPTFPVTGKVVDGKKPVANATVVLHPAGKDGPEVVKPRGKTDADGNFKLTTYDGDDGAPAGEYKVTVEQWLAGRPDEGPTSRLPAKYARPETSGFTATVSSGPTELPTIEVKR